ncbi:MAG: nucleoside hydrolase [Acidobacteriota bacterium]
MIEVRHLCLALTWVLLAGVTCQAQGKRMVIIDEDTAGPPGSDNLGTPLLLIQSPQTKVLGITVPTGDQWRDEEVEHALRMLEIIGRTDIPVVPGAVRPLVRRREETKLWEQQYGKVVWKGAWNDSTYHASDVIPPMPEGKPAAKPAKEDAAHFLVRMVRRYPHQVTIFEGGPMTNLALAISIDPEFPKLAKELVFMGGSLNPQTDNPEFANAPRHEFNLWFDPEAAHIVLTAPWPKIVCTPVDISIKTELSRGLIDKIARSDNPAARYMSEYFRPGKYNYMWDELAAAAWLEPGLITREEVRYMDVDLSRGAQYGNTLTWTDQDKPQTELQKVHIQLDLNSAKFYELYTRLMTSPTPRQAP